LAPGDSKEAPWIPRPESKKRYWQRPQRDAIRHVHLYEEPPTVPEPEVRSVATQQLAAHSPDGRPATSPAETVGGWRWQPCCCSAFRPSWSPLVDWRGGCPPDGSGVHSCPHHGGLPGVVLGLMRQQEAKDASDIVRHTLQPSGLGPKDGVRAAPGPIQYRS